MTIQENRTEISSRILQFLYGLSEKGLKFEVDFDQRLKKSRYILKGGLNVWFTFSYSAPELCIRHWDSSKVEMTFSFLTLDDKAVENFGNILRSMYVITDKDIRFLKYDKSNLLYFLSELGILTRTIPDYHYTFK
jgi:hypothetical protein